MRANATCLLNRYTKVTDIRKHDHLTPNLNYVHDHGPSDDNRPPWKIVNAELVLGAIVPLDEPRYPLIILHGLHICLVQVQIPETSVPPFAVTSIA